MNAAMKLLMVLLLAWLAYAVGAASFDETTQILAAADQGDIRGILIAAFGGAVMMLLLGAACFVMSRAR